MKITKAGKVVKNATVIYTPAGVPVNVVEDGVTYDVAGYEITEDKVQKKTRKDGGLLTTKDLKKK